MQLFNLFRNLAIVITLAGSAFPLAAAPDVTATLDSLNNVLSAAVTSADSIASLYDIFDLSPQDAKEQICRSMLGVAHRASDTATGIAMMRELATLNSNDTRALENLERESRRFPSSDEQKELTTYIRMLNIALEANTASTNNVSTSLAQLFDKASDEQVDIYDNIANTFAVCAYLSNVSKGELLIEYFARLEDLVNRLPENLVTIRNFYYSQLATLSSYVGRQQRSVEADRRYLKQLDYLETKYRNMGRRFRSLDLPRFHCYRRMLRNYEVLSAEDVDTLYSRILRLKAKNDDIRRTIESRPRSQIAYLMKHHRYAEAIPLIKKVLTVETLQPERRFYLRNLKEAAKSVGDEATLQETAQEYNDILEQYIYSLASERYSEIQARYDLDQLKKRNDELTAAEQITRTHLGIALCVGVLLTLLTIIVIIWYNYRRYQRLSLEFKAANNELTRERDEMARTRNELLETSRRANSAEELKNEFISEMSHQIISPVEAINDYTKLIHECVPPEQQRYMGRFVQIVRLNCELLKLLVNDVLGLSKFDKSKEIVELDSYRVSDLCEEALRTIESQIQPSVALTFTPSDPDLTAVTDGKRVVKVLENLLSNAAKFTSTGSIDLAYKLIDDGATICFTVTDTGIGIPADKEEAIFKRFEKLGKNATQGLGLGLPLCRLLSRLMRGDVKLDTGYTAGARFIFTTPVKL